LEHAVIDPVQFATALRIRTWIWGGIVILELNPIPRGSQANAVGVHPIDYWAWKESDLARDFDLAVDPLINCKLVRIKGKDPRFSSTGPDQSVAPLENSAGDLLT
jgi:hypothetical protein